MRKITISDLSGDFPIFEEKFTREGDTHLGNLIEKFRENYTLFAEMTTHEMVELLRLSHREIYGENITIFEEGEVGSDFYLIVFGGVRITSGGKELAQLKQGSCFGEMAILEDTRRNATATASERTLLLSINREALMSTMPDVSHKVLVNMAKQLAGKLRDADTRIKEYEDGPEQDVTEILPGQEITEILKDSPHKTFETGQTIFKEGDPGDNFYLIIYGTVEISLGNKQVARLGPGQCFGEMAAFGDSTRNATATTLEETKVLSIDKKIFKSSMPDLSHQVLANLAKQLADKLREADRIIKGSGKTPPS